jgi:serine O-acetyltransferase
MLAKFWITNIGGLMMCGRMKEDIEVVFEQAPAARRVLEVVLTYSGLHAVWSHRIAHALFKRKFFFLARVVSQVSRFFTGIEIHRVRELAVASLGTTMGVVIGETCEIGNDVTIFQGVTLGGTGKQRGKRHPTLHDNVLVATGAKVLGSITIGENSKVGAGSVVLKNVPPNSTVVGIPGTVVVQDGIKVKRNLDHQDMPDPVADKCNMLEEKIAVLREQVALVSEQLEKERNVK